MFDIPCWIPVLSRACTELCRSVEGFHIPSRLRAAGAVIFRPDSASLKMFSFMGIFVDKKLQLQYITGLSHRGK